MDIPDNDPVVAAGGNQTVDEADLVLVSATYTDTDGGPHTATIDWDDGTVDPCPGSCTITPAPGAVDGSHTYADDAVFTVTVIDGAGGSGSDALTVTVDNVAPTVTIDGEPVNSPEGTAIALTSTVNDPGTADTHTYLWAASGCTFTGGTIDDMPAFNFTPTDDGACTVDLQVMDDDSGVGNDQVVITIDNVPPTVSIDGEPANSDEGTQINLTSTVIDPGADAFPYTWSVSGGTSSFTGGGTTDQPTFDFTPNEDGTCTVDLGVLPWDVVDT